MHREKANCRFCNNAKGGVTMARGLWHLRGGGGTTSDELTATRDDVIAGKTAVTSDSDDEPVQGTMANHGAKNASLNCGQVYQIPKGFHNGAGTISANSLASQTGGATATDDKVVSGYKYWKDGILRTGTMNVQSAYSFNAAAVDCQHINITWTNPSKGPYSGVFIQMSTGGYPGATGGTRVYTGLGWNTNPGGVSGCQIPDLTPNTSYYFTIVSYCTVDGGTRDMWSDPINIMVHTPARPIGSQNFTTSGVFTVPTGVYFVDVCLVGGGGAGGCSGIHAGGGGAGYVNNYYGIAVTPGQQINVSVGGGGTSFSGGVGANGGTSYFGAYAAGGGFGGTGGNRGGSPATSFYYHGGNGGSGGGNPYTPGSGGSDGSDGGGTGVNFGIGQHSTTRAFGGTLYAGGGAGENNRSWKASGGPGGGGDSGNSGTPNTGGGGGGKSYADTAGHGGSGIVVIKWG